MFSGNEIVFRDYEYEEEVRELQAYERRGNIGVFHYGAPDSEEHTWSEQVVIYRAPVLRSREEMLAEQRRMMQLGVYDDESSVQQRLCVNS